MPDDDIVLNQGVPRIRSKRFIGEWLKKAKALFTHNLKHVKDFVKSKKGVVHNLKHVDDWVQKRGGYSHNLKHAGDILKIMG